MKTEVSASVYSVITADKRTTVETIDNYNYGHTTVVKTYEAERFNFFIVKTTAWENFDSDTLVADGNNRTPKSLVGEAFYLANYQLDRYASGLIGGILAGSQNEAERLVAETAVAR